MSRKFQLSYIDLVKIAKGAVIAGIAAILAYLAQQFGLTSDTVDIVTGPEANTKAIPPVAVWWLLSVGVNLFRKWFFDNTKAN
ncbi:MAG: hypothetical protein CMJ46_04035 [Planctomyces sp.]|nr:hypothetical protein [Planctomyces sp.]